MRVRASSSMGCRGCSAGVGQRVLTCFEGVISTDMVDVYERNGMKWEIEERPQMDGVLGPVVSEVCQYCLNTGLQVECLEELKMLCREAVRALSEGKAATGARHCGSHRRVWFFGAGPKARRQCPWPPLVARPNETCNNAAHFKTQSGHHPPTFVALAWVIRWLVPVYFLGSAVHQVSPGVGLLFTCFPGDAHGPSPCQNRQRLIRSSDPAPFP